MGRSAEITRDEVKFYKFIQRLRFKFCTIFTDVLKKQLILKGVMSEEDWSDITEDINFVFNEDSYFAELRETEILKERLQLLAAVEPYVGKYFSTEYIRKTILKQDEEQLDKINSQIEAEQEQMQLVQQAQMMQQQAQMMQQQEQQ